MHNFVKELSDNWGNGNPLFAPGPVKTVDHILGTRQGQPQGVMDVRRPDYNIVARFKPQVDLNTPSVGTLLKPLLAVTRIKCHKIHFSGLPLGVTNVFIDFTGSYSRDALDCTNVVYIGAPHCNNGILCEFDPAVQDKTVEGHSRPLLDITYRQPRELANMGMRLKDMDGMPLDYEEIILWLQIECEAWQ